MSAVTSPLSLILASSSPYRKQLLARLGVPFECANPQFDEEKQKLSLAGSSSQDLCRELARGKAASLTELYPQSWIIGSDQALDLNGEILGKQPNFETALAQLKKLNGKVHHLVTAVCLFRNGERPLEFQNVSRIEFKNNSNSLLERYLKMEQPYDCAGCYKMESHGMALVKNIECTDSTAIVGLPLIELAHKLELLGFELLQKSPS